MKNRPRSATDLADRIGFALTQVEGALALAANAPTELDLAKLEAPPDKIVAEALVLLREVASCGEPALQDRALGIAHKTVPLARNQKLVAAMILRPSVALDLAMSHILLQNMGLPDLSFSDCLARAVASPAAGSRERLPYRKLEQEWLSAIFENRSLLDSSLLQTSIATGIDLVCASRDDIYSLTHSVAYATDFGRWRLPPSLPATAVLAMVDSALAHVMDDDDFDLAAELLLAWPCLASPFSPTAIFALNVLLRVEREAGILPSLALRLNDVERQPEHLRGAYLTATSYHTALVMGLACTMAMKCTVSEETEQQEGDQKRRTELSWQIFEDLWRQNLAKQWLVDAASYQASEFGQLSSYLCDIALRRSMKTLNFAKTRSILAASLEAGVPSSPFARQVAYALRGLGAAAGTWFYG